MKLILQPDFNLAESTSSQIYLQNEDVLYKLNYNELIHCPNSYSGTFSINNYTTIIGIEAFAGCRKISSIFIPASIKSIGHLAFSDCIALEAIYLNTKQVIELKPNSDIFYKVDKKNCVLYVPVGSKAAYQKADQWKEFENIIEHKYFNTNQTPYFQLEVSKQAI